MNQSSPTPSKVMSNWLKVETSDLQPRSLTYKKITLVSWLMLNPQAIAHVLIMNGIPCAFAHHFFGVWLSRLILAFNSDPSTTLAILEGALHVVHFDPRPAAVLQWLYVSLSLRYPKKSSVFELPEQPAQMVKGFFGHTF